MEDSVTLNQAEQRRLLVLNHLEAGALVNAEAAELLGVSTRQIRRLRAAYRERGAAALAHGNRGRRPAHALDPALAARVVELATSTYAGFNREHLTEMLATQEDIHLSRPSVHRILARAGVAPARKRRAPRHRRRRERMPQEGMLLQVDGSRHDWLEGRGPYLTLLGGIDDATGVVPWACFREQEDAHGYFQLLREVVRRRGIPLALYSDRHSIFFVTKKAALSLEEQLSDHPANAVWSTPWRARHSVDRGALSAGQRPCGTSLGHLPGSPRERAATGWRGQSRTGECGAAAVSPSA